MNWGSRGNAEAVDEKKAWRSMLSIEKGFRGSMV